MDMVQALLVGFGSKVLSRSLGPGLPDGIFSNQKSHFGKSLAGFAMEDVGLFCCHLVYFTTIWYIL
jgi:hypothetical protein